MHVKTVQNKFITKKRYNMQKDGKISTENKDQESAKLKRKSLYERRFTQEESEIWKKKVTSKYDEKDTKSITTIQSFWQHRRTIDRLLIVNPKAAHSPDFAEFLHGQKIKKSINRWKMELLLTAIREGNWQHKIFSVRYLPELTVALFARGEITQQQASSILELSGILKEHKVIDIVPVLDAKSKNEPKLSAASLEILELISDKSFQKFDQIQIAEFTSLVAELPPSEQYWFILDGNQDKSNGLAQAVINIHGIYAATVNDNLKFFCPSAGLRDMLGIVRFGLKNYVKAIPILGMITPFKIGEGLKQHKRYCAMKYRDTIPYTNVHGVKSTELSYFFALYHDIYHSLVDSALGHEILTAFLYLAYDVAQIISVDIKPPKSSALPETKETWDFKDSEYAIVYTNAKEYNTPEFRENALKSEQVTSLFVKLVIAMEFEPRQHILHFKDDSNAPYLATVGAIFILKFLENPQRWKDIKIDLDQFSAKIESGEQKEVEEHTLEFVRHYQRIKSMYPKIKGDSIKIQLLNVFLSETIMSAPTLFKVIPEKKAIAEEKVKFKKLTKKEVDEHGLPEKYTNTLWSTYNGRSLEGGDRDSHQEIMTDIRHAQV